MSCAEEAVPYFEALAAESSVEAYNEAEWLTDVIVKADRDQRALEFGEHFEKSALKQVTTSLLSPSQLCASDTGQGPSAIDGGES